MNIYAIRYMTKVEGQTEDGHFQVCYDNEEDARTSMLSDFHERLKEVCEGSFCETTTVVTGPNGYDESTCDYCRIETAETTYQWWIDKMQLQ